MRLVVSSFIKVYSMEQIGTPNNAPSIPKRFPPTKIANITQIAGNPTELPTTLG